MEKIEGIDLTAEAKQCEADIIAERRKEIQTKIRHVIGNIYQSRGSIKDLEDKLAKAKGSLARHQATYDAIISGNWDAIKDEPKKTDPSV